MAICKLEGEIVISTATVVGTFAGSAITMPVGRYFLNSVGSGGATRSFLAEFKYQLDTATGRTWTVDCDDTNDTSTGLITITVSGAATTGTWTSTDIKAILGFTTDLTGPTIAWQGTRQAKCLWLPNCGRSGVLGPEGSNGAIESDYSMALGTDGTPYVLAYATRYKDSLEFRTVLGSKCWSTHEVTVNESFETFYGNVIAYGLRLRYHLDRNDDATYRTWLVEDGNHFDPVPVREDWTGSKSLWAFRYSVRKTT